MLIFTVEIVLHMLEKIIFGGNVIVGPVVVKDSSNGYVNNIKMTRQRLEYE